VRVVAVALGALAVLTAVLVVVQANLLARLLADGVTGAVPPGELVTPLILLAVVLIVRIAVGWMQHLVAHRAAASVKLTLRRRIGAQVQELGPGWLGGQRRGALATTLGRGLDALDPFFSGYLPALVAAAVLPVTVLGWLLITDLPSGLVILVTLPLIPIFGVLVGLQTKKSTAKQWRALERLSGTFLDLVAGLPTLRAFGRAKAQAEAVRRYADEHRTTTMSTLRVAFLSALVLELVATLSVAMVAVPVGLRLVSGDLDLHAALVVLLLAPEAYLPLRAVGSQFHSSTEGLEVAERAFAVLDEASRRATARTPTRAVPDNVEFGGLTIHGLTVTYPGRDQPAVADASFSLAAGEKVALIGRSGAGKSTVLAVILGLVPADAGRVLARFDGEDLDLADVDPRSWRRHVAWVPQRPHLFARTVAENIRLGRPEATDAEVERAARAAHADAFVRALPDGYATLLGENGAGLSAGQQQRIALARAFLRDAPLLLLDEPTAALDASAEAAVVEATTRLMTGRTVLVVAHRPAVVAAADRVWELRTATVPA
jgi:ATP-binding cassette, subfamily C, bacterial CydD